MRTRRRLRVLGGVLAASVVASAVASAGASASACASFGEAPGGGDAAADGPSGNDAPNGQDGSAEADAGPRRIYVLGGRLAQGPQDDRALTAEVLVATQGADGALSEWTKVAPLPAAVHATAAVALGPTALLVVGGESGSSVVNASPTNVTLRASVGMDGTLSGWAPAQPLAGPNPKRSFHGAAVAGERIFVVGGLAVGADSLSTVLSTTFSEGVPQTWAEELPALMADRSHLAVATDGRHLYLAGGSHIEAIDSDGGVTYACEPHVLRSVIGTDGKHTAWTMIAGGFQRMDPGLAVHKKKLYFAGGTNCNGPIVTNVDALELTEDGAVGALEAVAPLPAVRSALGLVSLGDDLYAIGGDANAAPKREVYRAVFTAGKLTGWVPAGDLPSPRAGFAVVAR